MPLSQRSGIIEWCDDTAVMKDYLIGANNEAGAHKRYHPNDLTALDCRKKLAEAQRPDNKQNPLKVKKITSLTRSHLTQPNLTSNLT